MISSSLNLERQGSFIRDLYSTKSTYIKIYDK